ncbi:AbrB/MazE/SpoVT family DNA-binding domain-containing protein [Rhizobium leguminosarum]|uniref:AbrB/MazE/SpoVT family DNA-binding domain-containing protein n=1 Tax=Rhizobium TaxID=379 RepID=UPI00103099CD|nr:AbrB/MazE/SpoVT family DNA-binding domain-containing protein [Rhizobium leguminosarum]MBB4506340.1 AbrB family looped-hinge helix DNA binding protein [Rhizobium leguminosarum]TBH56631.1 AbrB family transcriptional regulator [Rhizobium leguminosarum]
MAHSENLIATVSTKGQIILPKTIRQRREWEADTRLIVEETAEGVLLRQAPAFSQTKPDDVFGMLPFSSEPKTLEDMEADVLAEARRRDGLEFADGI